MVRERELENELRDAMAKVVGPFFFFFLLLLSSQEKGRKGFNACPRMSASSRHINPDGIPSHVSRPGRLCRSLEGTATAESRGIDPPL